MPKCAIIRNVKSYLADILTFTRFVLAGFLLYFLITHSSTECVLVVFCIGELTDAFDGTCAKKWPFPKGKEPKYRRFAEQYDMIADTLLLGFMGLYIVIYLNLWLVAWMVFVIITSFVIEMVCYGRPFGHPNFCTKKSLYRKNQKLAEKILLLRRKLTYLPSIAMATIMLLFATAWPDVVKYSLLGGMVVVGVFLWFFLKARRTKVARD